MKNTYPMRETAKIVSPCSSNRVNWKMLEAPTGGKRPDSAVDAWPADSTLPLYRYGKPACGCPASLLGAAVYRFATAWIFLPFKISDLIPESLILNDPVFREEVKEENRKLKRMFAELALDLEADKEVSLTFLILHCFYQGLTLKTTWIKF